MIGLCPGLRPTACCRYRVGLARTRRSRAVNFTVTNAAVAEEQRVNAEDKEKAFGRLQNGSDVRGVAIDGVTNEPITLTPTCSFFIARSFAGWLSETLNVPLRDVRVSIGTDPRLSSPLLKAAAAAGIASLGARVSDFGLATTPAMFFSTVATGDQHTGAIMITASHLPFNRNGMKFFRSEGGLDKRDITAVLQRAARAASEFGVELNDPAVVVEQALNAPNSSVEKSGFLEVYAGMLRSLIKGAVNHPEDFEHPLKGFKIVVDAGNGSGGFFATSVLQPLGADIEGSQYLEPDGMFPNHTPNPELPEAMNSAIAAVVRSKADLGVVFDTDVDRSGVVDDQGRAINSNRYIALMSTIVLREHPGTTIVTDSVTSNGLTEFIESLGGKHFRYRRGYKNVINKGIELNEQGVQCELMMETSGHGAMKENRYLDDGAYLAVKIIIEMVRRRLEGKGSLSSLLDSLKEPKEAKEMRLKINSPDFKDISSGVLQKFHDWVSSGAVQGWVLEEVNHEGWRVNIDEGEGRRGWVLMRASLHDPIIVVNAESELDGGVDTIKSHLQQFFKQHDIPSDASPIDVSQVTGK